MSMLLVQVFKTLAGAQKRQAFENAHSKIHKYLIVFCDEHGQPAVYDPNCKPTYRLRKTRR